MINLANRISVHSVLVATGDDTHHTIPAIAAGVGVGAIGMSLFVRKGTRDDGRRKQANRRNGSSSVPPTRSRNGQHRS
ncbi:MAG: hypothetical protein IJI15_01920 [Atopobiaceae bacterium]|nr:hypothetical protein [Atopobiaceae bacterium]